MRPTRCRSPYNDIVNRARLQINGQDRFDERYGDYFWKVQPYQHHTGGGVNPNFGMQGAIVDTTTPQPATRLFGPRQPDQRVLLCDQAGGAPAVWHLQFSRIDNATLVFDSVDVWRCWYVPVQALPVQLPHCTR
jgi:hypothetical protein